MRGLSMIALCTVFLTGACATTPQATVDDRTLSYGCNDIVAVGSIKSGAIEAAQSSNDILGRGWISATLQVRKVIRGKSLPAALPVRYFAHTYLRQDRDFMVVLRRRDTRYEIVSGQLMSARPKVASHCG